MDRSVDMIRTDRSHTLDLQAEVEAALASLAQDAQVETDIDRRVVEMPAPQQDAVSELPLIIPTVDTRPLPQLTPPVDTLTAPVEGDRALTLAPRHDLVPGGPKLLRDRVALLTVVRFRLLSFRRLHALVFAGTDKAVASRRVKALVAGGFVTTWEEHLVVGGRPHWVLPTKRGLAWAHAELVAEAQGRAYATLLHTMLNATDPRPLVLAPRTAPPFLPHQAETNQLVAACEADPTLPVTWASTWHRPLPNAFAHLALPQPDAVLVVEHGGVPQLVFLEHDRGQEAPRSFARRKAERYHEFGLFGLAARLLGFYAFTVWVTVTDPTGGKPLARIRALQAVSRQATMLRFTLADWFTALGSAAPIWFTPYTEVTTDALVPDAHAELRGPFAPPEASAPDATALRTLAPFDPVKNDPVPNSEYPW